MHLREIQTELSALQAELYKHANQIWKGQVTSFQSCIINSLFINYNYDK